MACVGGLNGAVKCSGRLRDGAPAANLKKRIFSPWSHKGRDIFFFPFLASQFLLPTEPSASSSSSRPRLPEDDFAASTPPRCRHCEPYMPMANACTRLRTSRVSARETVRQREKARQQRGKGGWKSMRPRADFTPPPGANTDYCCCFAAFFFFPSFPAGRRSSRPGSKRARTRLRYESVTRVTLSDAVFPFFFSFFPALTAVCTKFKSGVCKTAGECITPPFYGRSQDRRLRRPSRKRHICRPNLFSPPLVAGVLAAGTPARTPDHAGGGGEAALRDGDGINPALIAA